MKPGVGSAASNFSSVLLNGGGAYYFEQSIRGFISLVDLPGETNPRGFLYLAPMLEDVKATAWDWIKQALNQGQSWFAVVRYLTGQMRGTAQATSA